MTITAEVLESQELLANAQVDPDKQKKTVFEKLYKSLTLLESLKDATPRDEIRKNRQGSSAYDNTPELSHEPKTSTSAFSSARRMASSEHWEYEQSIVDSRVGSSKQCKLKQS